VQEAADHEVSIRMGDETSGQIDAARALAREVNTQIERVAIRFDSSEGEFLCECGSAECNARLRLTIEEYERIRADENRFFIATGHDLAPTDRIVQRTPRYVVAEAPGLAPA
jgi:inactivated superfamily I helicase